jgi:hypothetical protein
MNTHEHARLGFAGRDEMGRQLIGQGLTPATINHESWEFEPSPTDPYHLFLMLKDLKGMLS